LLNAQYKQNFPKPSDGLSTHEIGLLPLGVQVPLLRIHRANRLQ